MIQSSIAIIIYLIGVIIGAFSAALMETKSLVLFFSLIIYLLALNLIFLKDKTKIKIKFNLFQRTVFGFVVGFISSLMGIGGAIMNVPILKFVGYTINKAIGTAASIGRHRHHTKTRERMLGEEKDKRCGRKGIRKARNGGGFEEEEDEDEDEGDDVHR